jgi:uncharacterized FAD-dependent dehydrogenase
MKKDKQQRNNYFIYDERDIMVSNTILVNGRNASDILEDYAKKVDLFMTENKINSAKLEIEVLNK